ncbi:MAG TPA: tetratricopeptide repeat protein [Acidobacteriota bacterium]|nr:tetratricopeptide repeat protein [Acidobacteriota bacterium]
MRFPVLKTVGSLALALILIAGWAQAAQKSETAPTSIENLANVTFSPDIRVFAVMAALNAAGYDYETPGREMSPARQLVRREVRKADADLLARLHNFYVEHRYNMDPTRQAAAYISLALLIEGPPSFDLAVKKEDLPADVLQLVGFEKLVRDLFQQISLADLWNACQEFYAAELASYRPVFVDVIRQTLDYFRIPPRIVLDRRIVVIPEMIGPSRLVNARNLEKSYYIIPGPISTPGENRAQLQHEYLHFLLDPLIQKFGTPLMKYEQLLNLAQNQPHVRSEYQNLYMMIVAESLIDTLILRMNPSPDPDRDLVALFRRGLIFSPYFYRSLATYETDQSLTMPAYVETLFNGVNDKIITEDEQRIAELDRKYTEEERIKREAERQEQQKRLRAARLRTMLLKAQDLIRDQQFDAARQELEQLLQEEPENAAAHFYLAQIASQQNDYQAAFAHYERAEQSKDATPMIRGWSKLRRARYLASQGDFAQARVILNEVIEMSGDLEGAREQAQETLAELPE